MADETRAATMEKIVALCKRRGFVFPGSEIYGGLANTWDFGPLGAELRNNIKQLWWRTFVQRRRDMVGLDGGILMHPRIWEASGHVVNFNDLDSVEYVCRRHPVAALITEPILQNIGVLKPLPGYLQGLRDLADRYGFVLIFDEVKTGFRYSVGGYSQISGVKPDLVVFAKAIANGFPISALGGKKELMDLFAHPDTSRRPLVAGTYNGHPVGLAAALATVERLLEDDGAVYRHLEELGGRIQSGIESLLRSRGIVGTVARQGSAFVLYLMDHEPQDWHDLAESHDFARDVVLRRALIERGVYFFPVATKQCSVSAAHTEADIDSTLEALEAAFDEF